MYSYMQQQIQTRMEAMQLNVTELEKKAGLSRTAAWQILKGRSKNPSIESLKAIADVLGCTVNDLIGPNEYTAVTLAPLIAKSHKMDKKLYVDTAAKEKHKWDEKLYQDVTKLVSKAVADKELDLEPEQIMALIKEGYRYSVAKASDKADKDFVNWLFDRKF